MQDQPELPAGDGELLNYEVFRHKFQQYLIAIGVLSVLLAILIILYLIIFNTKVLERYEEIYQIAPDIIDNKFIREEINSVYDQKLADAKEITDEEEDNIKEVAERNIKTTKMLEIQSLDPNQEQEEAVKNTK